MAIACTAIRPWPVLQAEPATCNTSHSALAALPTLQTTQSSSSAQAHESPSHRHRHCGQTASTRPEPRRTAGRTFPGTADHRRGHGRTHGVTRRVRHRQRCRSVATAGFPSLPCHGPADPAGGVLRLLLASHKKATEAIDVADPVAFEAGALDFNPVHDTIQGLDAPGRSQYKLAVGYSNYTQPLHASAIETSLQRNCLGQTNSDSLILSRFVLDASKTPCAAPERPPRVPSPSPGTSPTSRCAT